MGRGTTFLTLNWEPPTPHTLEASLRLLSRGGRYRTRVSYSTAYLHETDSRHIRIKCLAFSSIGLPWLSTVSTQHTFHRQERLLTTTIDLFQSDHHDINISKTSSYLDLSTLYGDTQKDQDKIRTFRDGKLKPDCFSEKRLLGFPAACGVMLIMLNRYETIYVEWIESGNR